MTASYGLKRRPVEFNALLRQMSNMLESTLEFLATRRRRQECGTGLDESGTRACDADDQVESNGRGCGAVDSAAGAGGTEMGGGQESYISGRITYRRPADSD
jgi:hypothetical protein